MSPRILLLVGGVGRLVREYRAAAEAEGYALEYAERKLPATPPRVARVIVVAAVCSHPLREAAQRVAADQGAPIAYLRTPSVSALRRALAEEVRCEV
jgi:hypothetical protein